MRMFTEDEKTRAPRIASKSGVVLNSLEKANPTPRERATGRPYTAQHRRTERRCQECPMISPPPAGWNYEKLNHPEPRGVFDGTPGIQKMGLTVCVSPLSLRPLRGRCAWLVSSPEVSFRSNPQLIAGNPPGSIRRTKVEVLVLYRGPGATRAQRGRSPLLIFLLRVWPSWGKHGHPGTLAPLLPPPHFGP